MKTKRKLVTLIAAAIVTFWLSDVNPTRAQEEPPLCAEASTVVYFGNGVFTTQQKAVIGKQKLRNALQAALPEEEFSRLRFDLAVNQTGCSEGRVHCLKDLYETIKQEIQTDVSLFFLILARLVPMPESFQDAFKELAAAFDASVAVSNPDVARHVAAYNANIDAGRKVVVVSHSQGNFFANQSFPLVIKNESFGIVSVANPDSFVGGGGSYTTIDEDIVINFIADITGNPLPSNLSNGILILLSEPLGHGFNEVYLKGGTASRGKIIGDVVNTIDSLVDPNAEIGSGIITVTLTWGAEPDVDLHVFEPNGAHVYYANLNGPSGFLDRDDITSFGPENYFVDCATLETGSYSVGVNYFFGNNPETATVRMRAGLLDRTFFQFLAAAVGPAGDNSPIPVAVITVTGSQEEGFVFTIN